METMGEFLKVGVAICGVALVIIWVWKALYWVWLKPMKMERYLRQQGIRGPPYRLLFGNIKQEMSMMKDATSKPIKLSHDILPRVLPFNLQMIKEYGKTYVTWFGATPRVNIMDPDLIREILSNKSGDYVKPKVIPLVNLLVTGLVQYEGEKWTKHRRIINPAFHQEKLKRMLPAVETCCGELIGRWMELVEPEGSYELDVWPELQNLTGDVISRTAFGGSYEKGRRIFQLQSEQAELLLQVAKSVYIPGYRFLPTKSNIRMKEIYREEIAILRSMINEREEAIEIGTENNDDLLGLLMESNRKEIQEHGKSKNIGMTIEEVIEECKLLYFAGQETTSVLLGWAMVVLSMHPEWQTRAREEVLQVFGKRKPDFDALNHLKIVTMILYEALRLYPPAISVARHTCKTRKPGEITLPPGVDVTMPIILVHHDCELWGEDANEFNLERFSEGVSKATNNQVSFFPFGWGPRICIGQNFAMIEAKMAVAMILQHFSFELSATYVHAPHSVITLQPQYGAQIILRKL